jgi:hypothetical protein
VGKSKKQIEVKSGAEVRKSEKVRGEVKRLLFYRYTAHILFSLFIYPTLRQPVRYSDN